MFVIYRSSVVEYKESLTALSMWAIVLLFWHGD